MTKLFGTFSIFVGALIFSARAEISGTNEVWPGIFIFSETRTNPPQKLFVAKIDLTNPKIKIRVSRGGDDPDGNGEWETTLLQPTKIAAREHFDLVINGDFFKARAVVDAEGAKSGYRAGQWALTEGPAMTDGKIWSTSTNERPCLVVHTNQKVTIEKLRAPATDDFEVVAGNVMLVRDGKIIFHKAPTRNPRTVVGLDASGKRLTILVVDGRKPGIAAGMSYNELAEEMLRLGCANAINLDGGGSSILAVRDSASGNFRALNSPTDGRERAVANVLGISVK